MQNLHQQSAPRPAGDGTYVISNIIHPTSEIPLIDTADTGKWIGAILAEPAKYEGKTFSAATRSYSFKRNRANCEQGHSTGKTVRYQQLPVDVFRNFLPPVIDTELLDMFQLQEKFGYFGPRQSELVKWSSEQARGKLTTLEEYLVREPLKLE